MGSIFYGGFRAKNDTHFTVPSDYKALLILSMVYISNQDVTYFSFITRELLFINILSRVNCIMKNAIL